jgi:hypothetical protein
VNFLSQITGSFAQPCAENPTVAMVEAAYRHHQLDWRYINCEVAPEDLGDAVRGARAMRWAGFNCSLPHKVAVIEFLDELGQSTALSVAGKSWSAKTPTAKDSCNRSVKRSTRRGNRSSFWAPVARLERSLWRRL